MPVRLEGVNNGRRVGLPIDADGESEETDELSLTGVSGAGTTALGDHISG